MDATCSLEKVASGKGSLLFLPPSPDDQVRGSHVQSPMPAMLCDFWPRATTSKASVASSIKFSSVQLLGHVQLFATPWTAACQASLSVANSRNLLKLMSIELDHYKLWKTLKEMGIPDHLTCPLRNLYAGQEAPVRIGHEQ